MRKLSYLDGKVILYAGDCLDVIKKLADESIDSVVTDPPYALVSIVKRFGKTAASDDTQTSERTRTGADGYARLAKGFMGKEWDNGAVAFAVEFWAQVLRVLKPGGHVAAFSGTRSYHRLACAIEDAGFEIRDQLAWAYGTGFPKSHDVSKGIDKAAGAVREVVGRKTGRAASPVMDMRGGRMIGGDNGGFDASAITAPATYEAREWAGWGTALKPAWEPICLARKPLSESTVAANVLRWGTGALNIDACRIEAEPDRYAPGDHGIEGRTRESGFALAAGKVNDLGRFPANIIHDGSAEVIAMFPESKSGALRPEHQEHAGYSLPSYMHHGGSKRGGSGNYEANEGSAARFFYSAKADADDRLGSKHPTVKPVDLMQWLCRLITPPGGAILDPFAGTGSTGAAAWLGGFRCVLVEREKEYQADIARRMALMVAGPVERKIASIKAKGSARGAGPLFGEAA